eukprot:CAMPEP_0177373994 /NCGR_PEP_ID=MMETSP0368-20130122/43915_1 /TAXON_ID=447022 ORGANISM="Scrippsiella hangoei-like, Strain SHHI-4" /NCGR_SAMPLE_ID=MMETSP0368 /ASSEMBLY_ACC=CAM_ASM_000363 /LENGTH=148 /DNA_ID=CAMNT_0018837549 /DNA_START=12 /DNA_END=458 /DNA_ORIENTATION=+
MGYHGDDAAALAGKPTPNHLGPTVRIRLCLASAAPKAEMERSFFAQAASSVAGPFFTLNSHFKPAASGPLAAEPVRSSATSAGQKSSGDANLEANSRRPGGDADEDAGPAEATRIVLTARSLLSGHHSPKLCMPPAAPIQITSAWIEE